MNRQN